MGNKLIQQCTGEDSKIDGFNNDLPPIATNDATKIQKSIIIGIPNRSPKVEQLYQKLISQRSIGYSLEGQKSTFQPIALCLFQESAMYIGWTKNDKPHGPGQLYFDNHNYLQAIFKEGEADCDDALFIQNNANYYRGAFKKSKQHGLGTLKNGDQTIVATFANGSAEGKGQKLFADGRIFRGYFKNGKMEGKGILTLQNNDTYCGFFRDDMRNGLGKLKTAQYEYYGPYRDDKKEGKGTVIFTDGTKFEGWFQNDRIEGYGEWHRENGLIQKGVYTLDLPT